MADLTEEERLLLTRRSSYPPQKCFLAGKENDVRSDDKDVKRINDNGTCDNTPPPLPPKCRPRRSPISCIDTDFDRYTTYSLEKVSTLRSLADPSLREVILIKGCARWLALRGVCGELAAVANIGRKIKANRELYLQSIKPSIKKGVNNSWDSESIVESSEDDSDSDDCSGYRYIMQTPHKVEKEETFLTELNHGTVSDDDYTARLRELGYYMHY